MKLIIDIKAYRKAQLIHLSGQDVIANLYLKKAYGVE